MRALISVFDKYGIEDLATTLHELGVEIISTGGTANKLKEIGIPVKSVSSITQYPEIMDGRVKTLNPNIHGGILAKRNNKEHQETVKELNIPLIDIVVVNLYPFEDTIANNVSTWEEIIEKIDIGGPSMIRSAAKNYEDVLILVNPEHYQEVISQLKSGKVSMELREKLALEAFSHTAYYDAVISNYFRGKFAKDSLPQEMAMGLKKKQDLRYGENAHQKAALYSDGLPTGLIDIEILQGKELSFNNYIDMQAAYETVKQFTEPAAVIIKHTNPCGAALAGNIQEAYKLAYEADTVSAFGGIVGLNRECDAQTAEEIAKIFVEVIIAPSFSPEALEIFAQKQNLRLISKKDFYTEKQQFDVRKINGGLLVQEKDTQVAAISDLVQKTIRNPSPEEIEDLLIAEKLVKQVKSNAIVLVKNKVLVGVGAGQMSRVESVELAIKRAGEKAQGAVLGSDAFFPFPDSVELAAKAGITAIIQPGGSKNDEDSIKAADNNKIAMVFTGLRHFKH